MRAVLCSDFAAATITGTTSGREFNAIVDRVVGISLSKILNDQSYDNSSRAHGLVAVAGRFHAQQDSAHPLFVFLSVHAFFP